MNDTTTKPETSTEVPVEAQPAKPKYENHHLDISGFGVDSTNPKAPLANLKQFVTVAGLEAQLKELKAANVEEANVEMVMFGGEFEREGKQNQWYRVVRSRSNSQANVKTL